LFSVHPDLALNIHVDTVGCLRKIQLKRDRKPSSNVVNCT
jgi:hypothetical protein